MNKRITILLAVVMFTSFSFAQKVGKEKIEARAKEIETKGNDASKLKFELDAAISAKVSKGVTAENVQKGLSELFSTDVVKKIKFAATIAELKLKTDDASQKTARHVEYLLSGLGDSMPKSHRPEVIILLKNFEMAMTEMGEAAVLKFESQIAWTNRMSYSVEGQKMTGEQIQIVAIANSFKKELNEVLKEGEKLEEGKYYNLAQGVKSIKLSDAQVKAAKDKYNEFLAACKG